MFGATAWILSNETFHAEAQLDAWAALCNGPGGLVWLVFCLIIEVVPWLLFIFFSLSPSHLLGMVLLGCWVVKLEFWSLQSVWGLKQCHLFPRNFLKQRNRSRFEKCPARMDVLVNSRIILWIYCSSTLCSVWDGWIRELQRSLGLCLWGWDLCQQQPGLQSWCLMLYRCRLSTLQYVSHTTPPLIIG